MTQNEFINKIENTHGSKYTLISEYSAYNRKVLMKCNICGNQWMVLPNNLISKKSGCPECYKKTKGDEKRLTHEEFTEKLNEKYPNRYTLLTEYIDAKTKVLARCNIDGYEWEIAPSSLLRGTCPKCGNKVKRTNDMFIDEVKEKYGDEYSVLGEFVTARKKVSIRHNICGNVWEISPDKFLKQNRKCPNCFGKLLKNQEKFEKEIYERFQDRYTILGKYVNSKTHLLVKCNRCENQWMVTPDNLLRGFGCPECNVSKGENKINDYLKSKNINYIFQHSFEDLYGNYQPLRFDFALIKNEKIQCLIEFDGLQHFELAGYATQEKFELQKSYDEKKNQYCKKRNIPLYRIPYWDEDNIPDILENILNKHML